MSDTEKKHRQIMKDKCFHCNIANHFANNCPLAKDIKCKKSNVKGHIAAACTIGGNATEKGEGKDNLL